MSLGYLVDTDWVIDHFHGIDRITRKLEELRPSGLAISVVSLAELYEGIHYSRDPARGREVLARVLDAVTVLPLDEAICDRFGLERGRLRQQRLPSATSIWSSPQRVSAAVSGSARTTGATSRW